MAISTLDDAGLIDGVTYESHADERNWLDQGEAAAFMAANKPVVIIHDGERTALLS